MSHMIQLGGKFVYLKSLTRTRDGFIKIETSAGKRDKTFDEYKLKGVSPERLRVWEEIINGNHAPETGRPTKMRGKPVMTKIKDGQKLVAAFVSERTKKRLEAMARKRGLNLSQLLRKQFDKMVG